MTTNPDTEPVDRMLTCCIALIFIILFAIAVSSCAPVVIEKVHYQHDTTYIDKLRIDSLYIRDSIYIKDKGDTVWIYKEYYRDRWHYEHDTVAVVRVDSVAVEREKIVEVEKPLSWLQKTKQRAFWWLVGAVLALGGWTLRKPLMKILRR